jgi:hypothetical protein
MAYRAVSAMAPWNSVGLCDPSLPRLSDGKFLHGPDSRCFAEKEIASITASGSTRKHARDLEKMGLVETDTGQGCCHGCSSC